jgi:hypothetical protein
MRSKDEIIKEQREEIKRLKITRDFMKDWIRELSHYLWESNEALLRDEDE